MSYALPDHLATAAPQVGQVHIFAEHQPPKYRTPNLPRPRSYTVRPCVVVTADPLTVTFRQSVEARYGWVIDGERYEGRTGMFTPIIPAGTPVQVPSVGALWEDLEAWLAEKNASVAAGVERARNAELADKIADHGLTPGDGPTVTVDADRLLHRLHFADSWLGHRENGGCTDMRDELERLQGLEARYQDVIAEWETAEAEAVAAAEAAQARLRVAEAS